MPVFTMKAASKGKPPTHLADLSVDARKKALKEAGFPTFRADQLSRHYFERHEATAEAMTDLPSSAREQLVETFLPPLLTKVRDMKPDQGRTIKSL